MAAQKGVLQQQLVRRGAHGTMQPLPLEEGKVAVLDTSGAFLINRHKLESLTVHNFLGMARVGPSPLAVPCMMPA